ncbi:MAG TPA: DegT/DnrJ/EryC1/StrS family aminotransferase [Solirubrobacteraceae bacterium]|jgi:dTDP-4-amino-4,6-dideoxygalactose transaminase|nr:DegT/DnrJ/EryC1/StrS family aminotransferase [Solirubrobacteraceae bacterium]
MPVPLFDTETPLADLRPTILERVTAVIAGGQFILGPEVRAFERELAAYVGVGHAIGVGNGTDAITIAARALGIEPGDEVVLPSYTFYATAEAIASMGAIPVFCDVDRDTRNITAETVSPALTPRTRAIVAVDLFGMPAEIATIRDAFGLPVIEDAAQALGADLDGVKAGALGDIATFSFYPSKNLGAFGDGGAITTDDAELAERARALRFHGSRDKQTFDYVGYNSRLDEIQAAVLRVLLPQIDVWCDGRRAGAQHYIDSGLGDHLELGGAPLGATPAWHLYVVTHPDADAKLALLNAAEIQARAYYRVPLHRQPAMAPYVTRQNGALELPVTEELARTGLALPISPVFTRAQADEVVAALAAA